MSVPVESRINPQVMGCLKREVSILSPSQEQNLRVFARHTSQLCTAMYSDYVPAQTLEKINGIEKKILVTDKKTFNKLTVQLSGKKPAKGVMATYFDNSGYIICRNPDTFWDLLPDTQKREYAHLYKGKAIAKKAIGWSILEVFLTHEITHAFQDQSLPLAFRECAAYYYSLQVLSAANHQTFFDDYMKRRIGFYEELLREFGNDIHCLSFGKSAQPDLRAEVMGKLNQQADALFPYGSI
jgi:hypothetical protein